MPNITISIDQEEKDILQKRAKKNLFSLKEQIEDIVRRSTINYKSRTTRRAFKSDDKLVGIFSRQKSGRKRK